MECKLSAENTVLEQKLKDLEKQVNYWRSTCHEQDARNKAWCDRVDLMFDNMHTKWNVYNSGDNLEQKIFTLIQHYQELLGEQGKELIVGQHEYADESKGHTKSCRTIYSSLHNYCPGCGVKLKK
jgi:hypothetical protein